MWDCAELHRTSADHRTTKERRSPIISLGILRIGCVGVVLPSAMWEPAQTSLNSVARQRSNECRRIIKHAVGSAHADFSSGVSVSFLAQFSCCDNCSLRNKFSIYLFFNRSPEFVLDFFMRPNIGPLHCEDIHAFARFIFHAYGRCRNDHSIDRPRAFARAHSLRTDR
jgi:hypothetical protein